MKSTEQSDRLVLGPVLRHVDETTAAVWVEVAERSDVSARIGDRSWSCPTFAVHGHHYALVEVTGLEPGSCSDYTVAVDGTQVWPPADSSFPPSQIRTLGPDRPLRIAYGSCRTSVPHDAEGNKKHGVDVLRAYALRMAGGGHEDWPDLVLLLGDQVYADETSDAMRKFIASRRDIDQPPGGELKDYHEYAHLYSLAWSDPANRWLFSTLPTAMIFDDHDVRDDWNTSHTWRVDMAKTSWWQDRIVGALASYWVYQHLGNLSPADRAEDPMWQHVLAARETPDTDLGELLDRFADRANTSPDSYRWSYARELGTSRLVVIDSRSARVLEPGSRHMVDAAEVAWLTERMRGDVDHLILGTSLPYLLPLGLHHLEAWNESVAEGAWGERPSRVGEKIRQAVDLEHWAAFQKSFREIAGLVTSIADGERGRAPASILFLSGDVHFSYLAEVERNRPGSRILQAVCSPIRNSMPRAVRAAQSTTSSAVAVSVGSFLSRRAKVPAPPFSWDLLQGPWFDNSLATLEARGRDLTLWWECAEIADQATQRPELRRVCEVALPDERATRVPA
ncbi:MAG: alkaline phosphatase D family protein [Nocardioidaceae bacterium]